MRVGWTVVAFALVSASSPLAREVSPQLWPLKRIIANIEGRLVVGPDDPEAHYNLGRAHGFAFALEADSLAVSDSSGSILPLWRHSRPRATRLVTSPPHSSEQLQHVAEGVLHLRKACELATPDDPLIRLTHLTFAWLLETGAHLADRVDTLSILAVKPEPLSTERETALREFIVDLGSGDVAIAKTARETLSDPARLELALPILCSQTASSNAERQRAVAALIERYWLERAIAEYWRASELAFAKDLETAARGNMRDENIRHMTAYEALEGYCRLIRARGVLSSEEDGRLADAVEKLKQFNAQPRRNWITPIVLSLEASKPLDELIAADARVPFDLDGDGVAELWPWLAPDAGWLVWDPERRGQITSGRQLFGSASAWLFFEDGYRVLDALDDDRNGRLEGAEPTGIAVWFDHDSDGVSDPGEVSPVDQLGVVALLTQATERVGRSLANPCGLELANGRVLPTYDWVLAPAMQ